MIGWFSWNNMRSDAMGLWVNALPPIIRPEERNEKIEIPGRAGSLIALQGKDVYKSYIKECTVVCRRDIANLQSVLNWLRGEGIAVFGNEPNKAYKGMILSEVRFERIDNNLMQAVIPFYVEPFKTSLYPAKEVIQSSAVSSSIYNPGDVESKPKVVIEGTAGTACSLTIAGTQMTFYDIPAIMVVDCDSEIIFSAGMIGETIDDIYIIGLYTGRWYGEYWKIPKGQAYITKDAGIKVTIYPNWRWI